MVTRVVHCKAEQADVYIGRPSKWGNPFSHKKDTLAEFQVETREEAIEKYREWIMRQPILLGQVLELKGKVLGCWCKPKACHGDVLIELIAEQEKQMEQLEEFLDETDEKYGDMLRRLAEDD